MALERIISGCVNGNQTEIKHTKPMKNKKKKQTLCYEEYN